MKRYTVNVHYDVIITVEVEADNERQAIELAENRAGDIPLTSADNVELTESCVTNIEEMQGRANQ